MLLPAISAFPPSLVVIEHYREMVEVSKQMPQTHIISTCDREADFFELFAEQANNPGVDLLEKLTPPTQLGDAVELVAKLGGYLGRKNDPPLGHQIMWLGYTVLQYVCMGFSLGESIEFG